MKTIKELERDLDRYQAQVDLLLGRGPNLPLQDAFDLHRAELNLTITHVEIQRQRIEALEGRVDRLERNNPPQSDVTD